MEISDETINREHESPRDSISEKEELSEHLLFIKMMGGHQPGDGHGIFGVSKSTAYEWQDRWNDSGTDSIRSA